MRNGKDRFEAVGTADTFEAADAERSKLVPTMTNHPNRSKRIKEGRYDLGSGWTLEYFEAKHSGAPETMEFYRAGSNHPVVILNAANIQRLREICRAA